MTDTIVTVRMSREDYAMLVGLLIEVKDGRRTNLCQRAAESLRVLREQHKVLRVWPNENPA